MAYATHLALTSRFFTSTTIYPSRRSYRIIGGAGDTIKHEETIFLPQAWSDWIGLRVMDFPNFLVFNSELHRIVAQLRLCGGTINDTKMIDKSLSNSPPICVILAQQYRNMKFTTNSKLMSYLFVSRKATTTTSQECIAKAS